MRVHQKVQVSIEPLVRKLSWRSRLYLSRVGGLSSPHPLLLLLLRGDPLEPLVSFIDLNQSRSASDEAISSRLALRPRKA